MSSRIAYNTCEPFRAWNRLEPRTRKEDFDKVLQAGVHDALWFLTRQWQFGEFQGEDNGSAIFSKIHLQTSQLSHYKAFNDVVQEYSDAVPLEMTVEQLQAPLDHKTRIQAGKYFVKILKQAAAGTLDFVENDYRNFLKQTFVYQAVEDILPADSPDVMVEKAKFQANADLKQFCTFFSAQDFDGYALYLAAKANLINISNQIKRKLTHNFVQQALSDFIVLVEDVYAAELNQVKGAWNPPKLEYQFQCALPEEDNTLTLLTSDEYYTGELDWYSFDMDKTQSSQIAFNGAEIKQNLLENHVLTVIPTEARFSGMPNSRWWQFENGIVDLGNIQADTTDITKLIFSEYALMYANNWHIIPIPMPVGTLAEVKGIMVKDVFGQYEFVSAAAQGQNDNWTSWGMFNLSSRTDKLDKNQGIDTRLWIPPAIIKANESKPLEQVHFLRDEMANMVWGIETKIDNQLGKGMDGHVFTNRFQQILEQISPTPVLPLAENAVWQYSLGNTVPENWIPFIPVHLADGQNRAIQFQRAAMPRFFKQSYSPIRPSSSLLEIEKVANKVKPFFIHEEEIPRAGAKVFSTFQRTRWYGGATFNWFGRRKTMGRGEGSSGLQFDQVKPAPKAGGG